jgi:hypothetical protein
MNMEKYLEDAGLDLIVRKNVYNCSHNVYSKQLITYCTCGCENMYIVMYSIYGREYRMRRNRNGRNVQLGPGKQTAKTWFDLEKKKEN